MINNPIKWSDFLEDSYVSELTKKGYKEVDSINLPDGEYLKEGGGYGYEIHNDDDDAIIKARRSGTAGHTFPLSREYDTGYFVITNNGIRGQYSRLGGNKVTIKNGIPEDDVYKIMTNNLKELREEKLEEILD